jgi:hypothetical protein
VLTLSNWFYRAQRSGKLPSNNDVYWRGDSGLDDAYLGKPVTGGWYDAGDNVKFNFPMAWSAAVLGWGILEFKQGYQAAGELDEALANIDWVNNYFLKCIINENTIVGQVGNGNQDHAMWNRPEDIPGNKPVYALTPSAPGSDVASAMGASLAIASVLYAQSNPVYSAELLKGAKTLYK